MHTDDSLNSQCYAKVQFLEFITLFYFNNCGVKFQLPSENWFWQLIACNSKCDLARSDDDDDDDDFDDDERKKSKKTNFSSNDRSGHDDQNSY